MLRIPNTYRNDKNEWHNQHSVSLHMNNTRPHTAIVIREKVLRNLASNWSHSQSIARTSRTFGLLVVRNSEVKNERSPGTDCATVDKIILKYVKYRKKNMCKECGTSWRKMATLCVDEEWNRLRKSLKTQHSFYDDNFNAVFVLIKVTSKIRCIHTKWPPFHALSGGI
jgi:hypothetical protein